MAHLRCRVHISVDWYAVGESNLSDVKVIPHGQDPGCILPGWADQYLNIQMLASLTGGYLFVGHVQNQQAQQAGSYRTIMGKFFHLPPFLWR